MTVMRGEEGGDARRRGGRGRMGVTRRIMRVGMKAGAGELMADGEVEVATGRLVGCVLMTRREHATTLPRALMSDCWLKARTGEEE